jgi:hypothetical protein
VFRLPFGDAGSDASIIQFYPATGILILRIFPAAQKQRSAPGFMDAVQTNARTFAVYSAGTKK